MNAIYEIPSWYEKIPYLQCQEVIFFYKFIQANLMFSKKADDTSLMPFLLFTIIWSNSTVKDRLRAEAII